MGKRCEITGKKSKAAASRSHSNIQTKRRQKPNLQKKTINGETVYVSARGWKTLKKRMEDKAAQ